MIKGPESQGPRMPGNAGVGLDAWVSGLSEARTSSGPLLLGCSPPPNLTLEHQGAGSWSSSIREFGGKAENLGEKHREVLLNPLCSTKRVSSFVRNLGSLNYSDKAEDVSFV